MNLAVSGVNVNVAEQHVPRLVEFNVRAEERHVGALFFGAGLTVATAIVSMTHEDPLAGTKVLRLRGDHFAHACAELVRDEEERAVQFNAFRLIVSTDIASREAALVHAWVVVSGNDVNGYSGVLLAELFELTVVGDVLVEEVTGNDQVLDSKVLKGTKDVLQRIETLGIGLARGQVHVCCYCDLQSVLALWSRLLIIYTNHAVWARSSLFGFFVLIAFRIIKSRGIYPHFAELKRKRSRLVLGSSR